MSINYSNAVASDRLQAVIDNLDAGASFAKLVIGTSALSGATGVLATFTLEKPSATIAGKVLTVSGVPIDATPSANGTAAKAELRDSDDTVIADGLTVGVSGSGADVIIGSTTIDTGVPATLQSATITHP